MSLYRRRPRRLRRRRFFGELEIHPFIPNPGRPELGAFQKSAEVLQMMRGTTTSPCSLSMGAALHAIEVPAVGGDTLFSDMYAAYDLIDEGRRGPWSTPTARHDFMKAFGHNAPAYRRAEMRETYPVVEYPGDSRHPRGHRRRSPRCYGCSPTASWELDDDESDALLERLYDAAETAEHQVRFHWEDA